jgi:anaerobic magnesium-protoporphyrin IX monomethyl ester cyclase
MTRPSSVLLAHAYFLAYDPKQVRKMKPYPPLATLLAAGVLKRLGVAVSLFDAMLEPDESGFYARLERERPQVVALLEDNFNFLTKMCTTRMREAALRMITAAKASGARVVVNGSDAADHAELYVGAGADAVILGETEVTLPDLLDAWESGRSLEHVAGLALPGGRKTPPRPFVEHLDGLPLPAWELVDVARYREAWNGAHGRLSWNVVTTRGCPFHCNWCAKPLFGTRYAQRSPAAVADELARLEKDVAPDHVWFADDIFGLTKRWIETFADEVAARGVRIPFTMQSRVDLMTPSACRALARAGAEEVWMGVESGSQRILDAMHKGTFLPQVREATRALRANGVRASWFLQLGYPGETWREILMTRDLVREERPDDVGVSVAYPLPGTEFYESVKDQLGAKTNWSDSDDLEMMFEGTYTGAFYRRVRDLLHEEAALFAPGGDACAFERHAQKAMLDEAWRALEEEEPSHRSANPTRPRPISLPVAVDRG